MAKEICEDCGRVYEAGPNSFLCPECRKRRQRLGARRSAAKRKAEKEKREEKAHGNHSQDDGR